MLGGLTARRIHGMLGARVAVVAVIATSLLGSAPAWGHDASGPGASGSPPGDRPSRGLVFTGLEPGRPGGPCDPRGPEQPLLAIVDGERFLGCSSGPDPAPPGTPLGSRPTTDELRQLAAPVEADVPCIGDGTSGYRVQAIYAYPAGQPNRYGEVLPLIRRWAASNVDAVFSASAAQTLGGRRVRFVTDASCQVVVLPVQVAASGDDTFGNTIVELRQRGFGRSDRKYLVWMDAPGPYCGIAQQYADDSVGPVNLNNGNPTVLGMVGRIDAPCWGSAGTPFEAHELMHLLGGVQGSAPHGTGSPERSGGHCTDEADVMCYDDDGAGPVSVTWGCPGQNERLFDCGHDDYFHTAPAPGSYLAGHWNPAGSRFLEQVPYQGPEKTVRLHASRSRVPAGRKIRLAASITPCVEATERRIALRWRSRKWIRSTGPRCAATFAVRVDARTTFRAVSPAGGTDTTRAVSRPVTVRTVGP